ncbi:hypothetical protein NFI96_024639 [Prochilodus magdalenae]|nr:hypothetical protein NFI96_024639 [Prochilodus magdalenae]
MYPHYRGLGRGTSQNFSDSSAGSSSANVTLTTSTNTTQLQEEKYSVAGSSQFVPSLNAITSNQDLQWLVQPSLLPTPGLSRSIRQPYPLPPRIGSMNPHPTQSHILRPGVIRVVTGPVSSTRRRNDEHETDQLENEKSNLQKEIANLQKEKEKLELVLEAHRPICKVQDSDSDSDTSSVLPSLGEIKIEPADSELPGPSGEHKSHAKQEKPKPKITIPPPSSTCATSVINPELESLHTPILISTPSLTPFTASLVFTYPTSSLEASAGASSHTFSHPSAASAHHGMPHGPRTQEPCGIAHRRSSSSGDQSDQSLNSPTILTL